MQYRERRRKTDDSIIGRGRDVRFGIFILGDKPPQLTHQEVLANVLEEARWAEEFGFDEVWLAEHHFSPYGTLANLPQIAAAIAAQTERIRIGTACMVAPFHDPIHLAEQIATVDALSGGRFDAGFGRGYQAHEFAGLRRVDGRGHGAVPGVRRHRRGAAHQRALQPRRSSSGPSTTSPSTPVRCSSRCRSGAR